MGAPPRQRPHPSGCFFEELVDLGLEREDRSLRPCPHRHRQDAEHGGCRPRRTARRGSRRARACGEPPAPDVGVVDRRHDREHERAAELERRVQQPAGEALLLGRDAARRRRRSAARTRARSRARRAGTSAASPNSVARVEPDRQEEHVRRRRSTTMPGDDQARDAEAHDQRRDPRRQDATSSPPGKIASPVSSADQPRSCCR